MEALDGLAQRNIEVSQLSLELSDSLQGTAATRQRRALELLRLELGEEVSS